MKSNEKNLRTCAVGRVEILNLFVAVLGIFSMEIHAKIIDVGPENGMFQSINSAIAAAAEGDTVRIHGGTYKEEISIKNKSDITIEGVSGPGSPVIIEGGETLSKKEGHTWKQVSPSVYALDYQWPHKMPYGKEFGSYGGGLTKHAMRVYEDDICLRGVRGRTGSGSGHAAEPYTELKELDHTCNEGDVKPYWWTRQPDIYIPGRFMYDEKKKQLFVNTADGLSPEKKEYSIPVIPHLLKIANSSKINIRGIAFRNALGYAAHLDGGNKINIRNCFFINALFAISMKNCKDCNIEWNFIQNKGFWERHWYGDCKKTVLWGGSIHAQNSDNINIRNNLATGAYSILHLAGKNINVANNLFSRSVSATVNIADSKTEDSTIYICNNVIHRAACNGFFGIALNTSGKRYIYRNICYMGEYVVKDGNAEKPNPDKKTYIYNNTFALISTIFTNPYKYYPSKTTVYRNNIFLVRSKSENASTRYIGIGSQNSMNYMPFSEGPDFDWNLYWLPGGKETPIVKIRFASPEFQTAYPKSSFRETMDKLGLEQHGIQASPLLKEEEYLCSCSPIEPDIDKLSLTDWREVYTKGLDKALDIETGKIRNFFALQEKSPAIDNGCTLPMEWPDTGAVKDGKTDIGALEHTQGKNKTYGTD